MARLPIRAGLTVFILLSVSNFCAHGQADGQKPDRTQTAKTFVQMLDRGEFASAVKDFDAVMLRLMPPDRLQKTWKAVLAEAGAYKKTLDTRSETSGIYQVVYVTCEFAKRPLDVRVVFNKSGKISGLQFRPATPKGAEEIWEGKLKAGVLDLRLVFHLFKVKDGYTGTMDSPDQGATGIALDEVRIKKDVVHLELKKLKIVVEGSLDQERQVIKGNFKQAGVTLPLTLKRVAKAQEVRRPQTPHKPYPYKEVEVSYENTKAGIKLAGTLTLPRAKSPVPAVLLITGSGAEDRDETIFGHKPFLVLADYLTCRGIAVLRLDDRGVGGSTGSEPNSTSADFADDVLAGVAFLKSRREINPAQIGLIGHSEGGLIAPLVASRSHDIALIVLLAGPGLPGDQILYTQGTAILKAIGADAEQIARQKEIQQRIFAIVREEKDNAAAQAKIKKSLEELASKLSKAEKKKMLDGLPQVEGQLSRVLTPWFRYFLVYDPRPALRKVTCPVLALDGEKDLQVDAHINLPVIAATLKEAGNKDVTIRELPNLNHLFQTCKTGAISEYGQIEETIAPVVLETIADWIQERTGKSKNR